MKRLDSKERKTQIVTEAINIIHNKGYSALSIRELARNVGITEPAIYRHFRSKNDIIAGILDRLMDFGEFLESQIHQYQTPREKIRQIVLLQLEFFETHPEITSVIFSDIIFMHNEKVNGHLEAIVRNRYKLLDDLIKEAKREGVLIDANTQDLGTIILGYLRSTVVEWRRENYKFPLAKRGQSFLDTLDKVVFINQST